MKCLPALRQYASGGRWTDCCGRSVWGWDLSSGSNRLTYLLVPALKEEMSEKQINWTSGDWGSRFSVFHRDYDLISFRKYGTASEMGFIHSPPAFAPHSRYSITKRLSRKYSGLPKFLKDEIKVTLFIHSLVIPRQPDMFPSPPILFLIR